MKPEFTVQAKIRKPLEEVFEAVADPEKLTQYFATRSASGRLEEGATVEWGWSDFPDTAEVKVSEVVPNELIRFTWEAGPEYETEVTMRFESLGENETKVSIHESGWRSDKDGLDRSYQNCEGWSQMLSALKAWIEHGVNLREGYY